MTYRVIHYGTGFSGVHALRGIISHPELELVGLVVHSDEKAGRDAGDIAGTGPTGVIATQDIDEAIALEADAFCYMASTHGRLKVATAELGRILESGKNVSTSSFGALIHPPSARPDVVERLQESARKGGAALLATGIEPGFFSDYLPVLMTGCSRRIDAIRIYELALYESGHQSDEVAFDIFGFGKPLDPPPPIVDPNGLRNWFGVVSSIAEQLGVELDGIETSHELLPADEGFDYQGRRIEAGTVAGVRFEIAGVVGGRAVVAIEHVTRTQEHQAPQWPRGLAGDAYRVVIDGSPHLDCEFNFREGDDHLAGGFNITAMRVVNAIPQICAAEPGVHTTFDLAPVTGRGRFVTGV
ncbi:MAG TPA: diacylglycerol kinase [Mycobacteriales bacterium]|jgi:4-hydroxy-tetrahydrodipicolinate reductase|nr:diacylglycerol kinase [Mycobacteriales bacterium]